MWSDKYAKKYQKVNTPVTFIIQHGVGVALSSILSPNGAWV